MTNANRDAKPWLEPGGKTASTVSHQLVWYPPFPDSSQAPYVVGKTRKKYMWEEVKSTKEESRRAGNKSYSYLMEGQNVDYVKQYTEMSYYRELVLPMGIMPIFAQEYTAQLTNKITQYSTLGGNTLISFGPMPKKLSMRISIVRAGNHWVPFAAMLETFAHLSGNQARYSGSLVLYAYDRIKVSRARKYKVMMETMSPSFRTEKQNIIDYDVTMLVAVDYSADIPSDWGRLVPAKGTPAKK